MSSVSRRSEGRRIAVNERGRRQSGGMISLSVGKERTKKGHFRENENAQEFAHHHWSDSDV